MRDKIKKHDNSRYFDKEEPNIQKPCKSCKFYCGTDIKDGDLCSVSGYCSKYYDWFCSKNGWNRIVEPFRKLRSNKCQK